MKATTEKEIRNHDDLFVLIQPSKLSLSDEFMQHKPRSYRECDLKKMLFYVIMHNKKDFYCPRLDPSFDADGKICFSPGMKPAVGKSYNWWEKNAKKFKRGCNSRLGTRDEYVAFIGAFLKKLVDAGWTVENAWNFVCNDSRTMRYVAKHTGSNEICGFFDLNTTYKILATNKKHGGLFVEGDCRGSGFFTAILESFPHVRYDMELNNSVGWIVYEKK